MYGKLFSTYYFLAFRMEGAPCIKFNITFFDSIVSRVQYFELLCIFVHHIQSMVRTFEVRHHYLFGDWTYKNKMKIVDLYGVIMLHLYRQGAYKFCVEKALCFVNIFRENSQCSIQIETFCVASCIIPFLSGGFYFLWCLFPNSHLENMLQHTLQT